MPPIETVPFYLVHPGRALTGESPLWDAARQTLWWIDIQGQRLLGYCPGDGTQHDIALPSMPGLVALAASGALVLGLEDGLWRYQPETRHARRLTAMDTASAQLRLNDGKPDRQGRLWFGTMDRNGRGGPVGALWRCDPDGSLHRMMDGITTPNAITVSLDGRSLFFADSPRRRLLCLPLDPADGSLGPARTIHHYPEGETPDGASIDAEGGIWVTAMRAGRIDRFLSDGTQTASIALPVSRPTMGAFGGPGLDCLYVTSQRRFLDFDTLAREPLAGHLLAIQTGFRGTQPFRCGFG